VRVDFLLTAKRDKAAAMRFFDLSFCLMSIYSLKV
jgi:hypothetical protein